MAGPPFQIALTPVNRATPFFTLEPKVFSAAEFSVLPRPEGGFVCRVVKELVMIKASTLCFWPLVSDVGSIGIFSAKCLLTKEVES
jgi:hypothetical protein